MQTPFSTAFMRVASDDLEKSIKSSTQSREQGKQLELPVMAQEE